MCKFLRPNFTKEDLRTGMLVRLRKGDEYIVFKECEFGEFQGGCLIKFSNEDIYNSWIKLQNYNQDLKSDLNFLYDIMEIYIIDHPFGIYNESYRSDKTLIWDRKECDNK